MNLSYILLTALLIATAVYIYSMYNFTLAQIKDTFSDELDKVFQSLLNLQPGQSKEAEVAIPQGTQIQFCPGGRCSGEKICPQNCIFISTPTSSRVIYVHEDVEIPPAILPTGTYVIRARYTTLDVEKLALCKVLMYLTADVETSKDQLVQKIQEAANQLTGNDEVTKYLASLLNDLKSKLDTLEISTLTQICSHKKIVIQIEKKT